MLPSHNNKAISDFHLNNCICSSFCPKLISKKFSSGGGEKKNQQQAIIKKDKHGLSAHLYKPYA